MNKLVPLIIQDLPQTLLFNFINKTMEPTLLISFSITFREEYLSVTMSFLVQFKSFIHGLMNGKSKIPMGNVELRINSRSNCKL